jgi:hypothetical protein
MDRLRPDVFALVLAAVAAAGTAACTPKIGGKCTVNTDCSITNTRSCDTSQPDGYCTIFNCSPNTCPDNAACVAFQASVPGCRYDDYDSPSRAARTLCMETCQSNSNCRDGYECADPTQQPWGGRIVDANYSRSVCILPADFEAVEGGSPPPVCPGGSFDAAPFCDVAEAPAEAGPSSEAAAEGGRGDAGIDAASDAGDASPVEGAADATGDAVVDAGADAPADATLLDAAPDAILVTPTDAGDDAPVESTVNDAGGDGR